MSVPAEFARDERRLARLIEGVRAARQVTPPNVCRVYHVAECETRFALTMESIAGDTLASLIARKGPAHRRGGE